MSDIHALSGAYAVDALDDDERSLFERHVAGCPTCTAEVESLREAASLLSVGTLSGPSPELQDRVMSAIRTVRPLPPLAPTAPGPGHPGQHAARADVIDLDSRRRRRFTAFLVAAAAVLAIGVGGVVWHQVDDGGPTSRSEQVLTAGDARSFTSDLPTGGTATVTVSKRLNEAVLVGKDMPAPREGTKMVLWLARDGGVTPAGVVPVGSNPRVVFDGEAADATGAAISIEDADAEPTTPSSDIVATFSFES